MSAVEAFALAGVSAAIAGLVCIAYGRYQHAAVLRDWEMLLTAAGQQAILRVQERMRLDALMVNHSYDRASSAFSGDDVQETKRLLAAAASVLTGGTKDRVVRLRGMIVCARMASAILPMEPLPPLQFKLWRIRSLAALATAAHHFLVAPIERFALRAYLTIWGLKAALAVAGGAAARADLAAFYEARLDWGTLDEAHLDSFRALLSSLAAEERVTETFVVDL